MIIINYDYYDSYNMNLTAVKNHIEFILSKAVEIARKEFLSLHQFEPYVAPSTQL